MGADGRSYLSFIRDRHSELSVVFSSVFLVSLNHKHTPLFTLPRRPAFVVIAWTGELCITLKYCKSDYTPVFLSMYIARTIFWFFINILHVVVPSSFLSGALLSVSLSVMFSKRFELNLIFFLFHKYLLHSIINIISISPFFCLA